ncbi:hypothetical protein E2562_027931, partial [Oryza meyeriana var. granulata]
RSPPASSSFPLPKVCWSESLCRRCPCFLCCRTAVARVVAVLASSDDPSPKHLATSIAVVLGGSSLDQSNCKAVYQEIGIVIPKSGHLPPPSISPPLLQLSRSYPSP